VQQGYLTQARAAGLDAETVLAIVRSALVEAAR